MKTEIVYFELNNWTKGIYYPAEEPFTSWMSQLKNTPFENENWVKANKICVVCSVIDMSLNYCITATKEWVEKNCPKLLTNYQQFLRNPGKDGKVYGKFGDEFLVYSEENIGIHEGQFI